MPQETVEEDQEVRDQEEEAVRKAVHLEEAVRKEVRKAVYLEEEEAMEGSSSHQMVRKTRFRNKRGKKKKKKNKKFLVERNERVLSDGNVDGIVNILISFVVPWLMLDAMTII